MTYEVTPGYRATPCAACGSCFRWLDHSQTAHCTHCHRPIPVLVSAHQILIEPTPGTLAWVGIDQPQRQPQQLPALPYHDPFFDGQCMDGSWVVAGNRRLDEIDYPPSSSDIQKELDRYERRDTPPDRSSRPQRATYRLLPNLGPEICESNF